MLRGINQKTKTLLRAIQEDGCLFLCFAEASPILFEGEAGVQHLNALWTVAKDHNFIDSDNVLIDHNSVALCLFGLHVRYDNLHHDADETIPPDVKLVFGEFKWKYSHFVIINREKECIFDSLVDSYSVKNGALKSMRWYYAD